MTRLLELSIPTIPISLEKISHQLNIVASIKYLITIPFLLNFDSYEIKILLQVYPICQLVYFVLLKLFLFYHLKHRIKNHCQTFIPAG